MKVGELELHPEDLVLVRPAAHSEFSRSFMARIDGLWTDGGSGEPYALVRRQIGSGFAKTPIVILAKEIEWVYEGSE